MAKPGEKIRAQGEEILRLKSEIKRLRRYSLGTNLTKVLNNLIIWGVILGLGWFTRDVLREWSGKITIANVQFNAQASFEAAVKQTADIVCGRTETLASWVLPLALVVSIAAILYGRNQHRLRRDVIEKLSPYQQLYEQNIDPKRSSSRLMKTGQTRPEDL